MSENLTCALTLTIGCLIGHVAAAQETNRILEDSAANRFLSEYQIVEDHPLCNRPDQLAYRVPMAADELEYRIYDPATRASAYVIGDEIVSEQECFVTQGFGPDRVRVAIPCGDDESDAVENLIARLDLSVALEAEATVCLSPARTEIIAHHWAVKVDQADVVSVHGNFSSAEEGATPEPVDDAPIAQFYFHTQGFGIDAWPWRQRDDPFVQQFAGTNAIRIDVDCVPVMTGNVEEAPLFLGFRAAFAVTDGTIRSCSGPHCPSFSRSSLQTYLRTGVACSKP